ncbi:MAG: amidase family protein, partial [Vicinamibacterales bacterium]
MRRRLSLAIAPFLLAALPAAQSSTAFRVEEATIAGVHEAMTAGHLTCRALVDAYLRRIDAYDKNGPALNAIVVINPEARAAADDLDRRFAERGLTGPLHCVPAIVKDNFETVGLPSAAGSLALEGFVSATDAFQVQRIKEAGAIVLAKSNMAEWAFNPYETVGSILPGYTRNPYALDRVTAGSSGGTAAAVAASFGLIGLGSDTGNSIRGPASHQSLAGIRSTMGLTSRAGVVPLNLLADIAGPMTRALEDAVAVLQVIAGEDPSDPATAASRGLPRERYAAALVRDGLRDARLGVLRQAYERDSTDREVIAVFTAAIADMQRAGATIVDPARVEGLDQVRRQENMPPCGGFKYDINRWFAGHAGRTPVKSLEEVIASRRFHPSVQIRLERAQAGPEHGPGTPACEAET